jgi:hypothetical protein
MSKKLGAVQMPFLASAALRLQGFGISFFLYASSNGFDFYRIFIFYSTG